MVVDISASLSPFSGTRIPLTQVRFESSRRPGKCVANKTVWRWMTSGNIGPDKNRYILPSWKIGGVRFTTDEAIAAFIAALSGTTNPDQQTLKIRTPAARREADRKAAEKLKALGI